MFQVFFPEHTQLSTWLLPHQSVYSLVGVLMCVSNEGSYCSSDRHTDLMSPMGWYL